MEKSSNAFLCIIFVCAFVAIALYGGGKSPFTSSNRYDVKRQKRYLHRILDRDKLYRAIHKKRIIVSTYFRDRGDPQYVYVQTPETHEYMAPWYDSMRWHQNQTKDPSDFPQGIIFCAELSDEFIRNYETPGIQFIRCHLGNYSTNDERFFVYEEMVHMAQPVGVAATDLRDVVVNKNPYPYLEQHPSNVLFVGEDQKTYIAEHEAFGDYRWKNVEKNHVCPQFKLPSELRHQPLCNAGCVAGSYRVFRLFVEQLCDFLYDLMPRDNFNMMALNYTLYRMTWERKFRYDQRFPFHYLIGYPLTSPFQEYVPSSQTDACFIHK